MVSLEEDDDASGALSRAAETVLTTENYDSLVIAMRLDPALLIAFANSGTLSADKLVKILADSRDFRLAESAGLDLTPPDHPRALLSAREQEVYDLLCEGLSNNEIADRLFISPVTVKVHMRHIFDKLGVHTRTQAVLRAQEGF